METNEGWSGYPWSPPECWTEEEKQFVEDNYQAIIIPHLVWISLGLIFLAMI